MRALLIWFFVVFATAANLNAQSKSDYIIWGYGEFYMVTGAKQVWLVKPSSDKDSLELLYKVKNMPADRVKNDVDDLQGEIDFLRSDLERLEEDVDLASGDDIPSIKEEIAVIQKKLELREKILEIMKVKNSAERCMLLARIIIGYAPPVNVNDDDVSEYKLFIDGKHYVFKIGALQYDSELGFYTSYLKTFLMNLI